MNLPANKEVTMTSIELISFINSTRTSEKSEVRHDHFLAKVPKVLGEDTAQKFGASYLAKNGEQRPCYSFPKREACLMAMSYSYELQAKVFDHMTALESQINSSSIRIPQTYLEALKELVAVTEKKEALECQNRALMHTTKTYTTTEMAKEIGYQSAAEFNKELNKKQIQFKQNGTWLLYSQYATIGLVEIKQGIKNDHAYYNTQWTQKGRQFLLALFNKV